MGNLSGKKKSILNTGSALLLATEGEGQRRSGMERKSSKVGGTPGDAEPSGVVHTGEDGLQSYS